MQSLNYRLKTTNLFAGPEARAVPLLVLFLDAFGMEATSWSAITIAYEIRDEFSLNMHPIATNRLLAAINLLTSNAFYKSLPDFNRFALALSGESLDDIADAEDCAIALADATMINPAEAKQPGGSFSEEILAYFTHILDRDEVLIPPDVFRFATKDRGRLADRVRHDFAEDAELLGAIEGYAADSTERINAVVEHHVQTTLEQLSTLPLQVGNAKEIAKKLLQGLQEKKEEGKKIF